MLALIVRLSVISMVCGSLAQTEDNYLHIGGIFPIGGEGGWQGGQVNISSSSS